MPERPFHFAQGDLYRYVVFKYTTGIRAQLPTIALSDVLKSFSYMGGQMNTKTIVALGLVHALSGCAMTPEEYADRVIEVYGPLCTKLGYPRESDQWRQCVLAQEQQQQGKSNCVMAYGTLVCN